MCGSRPESGALDAVVGSRMVYPFTAPETSDHVEGFVEHLASDPMFGYLAETAVLGGTFAAPDSEDQAAVGETIDRCRLPGEFVWAPPRHRRDRGPDPDLLRRLGNGAERHPRIDHGVVESGDVVPDEEPVPAAGFGIDCQRHHRFRITEGTEVGEVQAVVHTPTLPAVGQHLKGSYRKALHEPRIARPGTHPSTRTRPARGGDPSARSSNPLERQQRGRRGVTHTPRHRT